MKKLINTLLLTFVLVMINGQVIGQGWVLQSENGAITIKAQVDGGKMLDVMGVLVEGDDCFLDIKAFDGSEMYPVKLIASDSMQIPIAAIMPSGKNLPIVGVTAVGDHLPVKGISRFGNTIRVSVVDAGSFRDVYAMSVEGVKRVVTGVKFKDDNIEMEIGSAKIVAHVKALPTMDVKTQETVWEIKAVGNDGSKLDVVAVNKKGREYPVKAYSAGGSFAMLNVKADIGRDLINIKLVKDGENVLMHAIDYYGRMYKVQIKSTDGTYTDINGGVNCGKTIDIMATSSSGIDFLLHAISPEGDMYDVKGVKLMDDEKEGYLQGLEGLIKFYAHVKAFPPIG